MSKSPSPTRRSLFAIVTIVVRRSKSPSIASRSIEGPSRRLLFEDQNRRYSPSILTVSLSSSSPF
uniref:Uncharacterized protein n=1 Tax=Cucumis melo TaxID=3656 RepID=A0A9I9EJU7_CUCME